MAIKVTLTGFELFQAAMVGAKRYIESLRMDLPQRPGFRPGEVNRMDVDFEGACGELAVAKALGMYWGGTVNTFQSGGDLGNGIEVRTTRFHCLIIRPKDKDDVPYVLVKGQAPHYEIAGWMLGRDGKQEKYLKTFDPEKPPAYFVPRKDLRPIEELRDEL